jgi:serine protease AprX
MKLLSKNFFFVFAGASLLFAGPKVSPDLTGNSNPSIDVIVQYNSAPTKDELKQLGPYGQVKKQFVHVNAVEVFLSPATITAIQSDPNVKYVSPNRANSRFLDITTATVGANFAWTAGLDGTGIGVAIIDSGVYAHDDFSTKSGTGSRIVYSQSFVTGLDASDQYGHGTHVAGIVGSNGKDSTGPGFTHTFRGVAPNVNLINLRVLDANGAGTDSGVIAAIDQAITLQATYNIRIINLSLGRPVFESYTLDPLCQAVEAAWQSGIVVVSAAGNYGREDGKHTHGYGTIASPGNDPYVITVGAMNTNGNPNRSDDKIASYSSKGPTAFDHIVKPDLVAPGNAITSLEAPNSTLVTLYPKVLVNLSTYHTGPGGKANEYIKLSGTSMATPVVSGAAALLLQQTPSLTPDQVKARLMKTAQKALTTYTSSTDSITLVKFLNQTDVFTVGAGYLDIQAALTNTDLLRQAALSPVATVISNHTITVLGGAPSYVWGYDALDNWSVVWGDATVFGSFAFKGALNGVSVVWGADDSVVWGDDTMDGWSVVWGDSALTATSIAGLSEDDDDQ